MPTEPKPEPSPFSLVSHVFDWLPEAPQDRRKRTLAGYWKLALAQVDRLEKEKLGDSPGLVERVAFHVERGFLCAAKLAWMAADPESDPNCPAEAAELLDELLQPPREYVFLSMLLRAHRERLEKMRTDYEDLLKRKIPALQTPKEVFEKVRGESAFQTAAEFIERVGVQVLIDPERFASLQVDPRPDPHLAAWKTDFEEWVRRNDFPAGGGNCRDIEQEAESLIRKLDLECREVRAGVGKVRKKDEPATPVGGPGPQSAANDETPSHSEDFTSVNWNGTRYRFAKGNQAQTVRVLWEEWEKGGHGVSQETIKEKIGSSANRLELRKVFRKKTNGGYETHPAWGSMIKLDSRGVYRLAVPDSPTRK